MRIDFADLAAKHGRALLFGQIKVCDRARRVCIHPRQKFGVDLQQVHDLVGADQDSRGDVPYGVGMGIPWRIRRRRVGFEERQLAVAQRRH